MKTQGVLGALAQARADVLLAYLKLRYDQSVKLGTQPWVRRQLGLTAAQLDRAVEDLAAAGVVDLYPEHDGVVVTLRKAAQQ